MPVFKPSRRALLSMAAAMPALTLSATRVPAQLAAPVAANPAHFRFSLGQAQFTVISDGSLSLPASGLGVNADPAEVQAFLTAHFLSPETNYSHTNHLLVEIGEATEARRPGGATGTPRLTSQRIEVGDQFFDRRV